MADCAPTRAVWMCGGHAGPAAVRPVGAEANDAEPGTSCSHVVASPSGDQPGYPHSKEYLLDVTGYGNEGERMANGTGQSANGGRWRDRVSGEVAARPIRGGGGAGPQRGNRIARRRPPQARDSGPRVWRGGWRKGSSLRSDNRVLPGNRYRPRPFIYPLALYAHCSLVRHLPDA